MARRSSAFIYPLIYAGSYSLLAALKFTAMLMLMQVLLDFLLNLRTVLRHITPLVTAQG